jgi:hypothetical protein
MLVKTGKSEYKYLFFVIVFICLIFLVNYFYFQQSGIKPPKIIKQNLLFFMANKNRQK